MRTSAAVAGLVFVDEVRSRMFTPFGDSSSVICTCGRSLVGENPKMSPPPGDPDPGGPLACLSMPANTLILAGPADADFLIRVILVSRGEPQIGDTIIKSDAVFVVHVVERDFPVINDPNDNMGARFAIIDRAASVSVVINRRKRFAARMSLVPSVGHLQPYGRVRTIEYFWSTVLPCEQSVVWVVC